MCLLLFSSQLPPSPGSVTTREVEILVSLAESSQCWLWHDEYLEGLTVGPAGLSICPLPLGPPLTSFFWMAPPPKSPDTWVLHCGWLQGM